MTRLNRRAFLATAGALGAAIPMTGFSGSLFAQDIPAKTYKTKLYKSFIGGTPDPDNGKAHAAAGFEGLEVTQWDIEPAVAKENRKIADELGLRVQSVMRGWCSLSADDEAERAASAETIKKAIRTAAAYGADAVLVVPCRIDAPAPRPWDFKIDFAPTTCKVNKIVDGDNAPYAEYIKLQNLATERTFEALQDVIPVAAYEGVTIALENVWNNLWVKPDFAAAFVNMFDNRWVRAYLDLGNHVKYAPPVEWLRAFGPSLITKLHIKDYRLDDTTKATTEAEWKGFCGMGNGTVDWVEVRDVIDELGISGWISYEESSYTPAQYGVIMDNFVNGRKIVAPK